jgi:hypothetical protein
MLQTKIIFLKSHLFGRQISATATAPYMPAALIFSSPLVTPTASALAPVAKVPRRKMRRARILLVLIGRPISAHRSVNFNRAVYNFWHFRSFCSQSPTPMRQKRGQTAGYFTMNGKGKGVLFHSIREKLGAWELRRYVWKPARPCGRAYKCAMF